MRPISQHHVEQNQGDLGIGRFLLKPLNSERVVHHGVEAADRELIFAQIDDGMALTLQRVWKLVPLIQRCIGVDPWQVRLQMQQRLERSWLQA